MPRVDKITDTLLVVDLQNDFCPGGSLAVTGGDEIVPAVNALARRFDVVVATQDWHPAGHVSFASSHEGYEPFQVIELPGGAAQVLWPDHCVQGTAGAALHPELDLRPIRMVLRKGASPDVDSYSAFQDNDRTSRTGLGGWLRELGVKRVFLVGLALDVCVSFSAIDAASEGFEAFVIRDGCRAVDLQGSLARAEAEMAEQAVTLLSLADLEG